MCSTYFEKLLARCSKPVDKLIMNPSVSVIIPVYNRFELLKYSVESVLRQTLPVSEVILVDDGSIDGTSERLPRYIRENSRWRERVRYFHQENQGQSAATNRGIAEARCEWLAFNANDDFWLPQKLEWQFRALEKFQPCKACFTDAWFMNNPKMKTTLFELGGKRHDEAMGKIADALKYVTQRGRAAGVHPVWVQTMVVHRDLMRLLNGFDESLRYGDDDDFVFRLACETQLCYVSMPMMLIDRTPPAQRHIGAATKWDTVAYRLEMTQKRYEKRLRMMSRLPAEIQAAVRRDLAAVHSEWANWYLERGCFEKAAGAVSKAASLSLTPGLAIKWLLTRFLPSIARKSVVLRQQLGQAGGEAIGNLP